MNRHYDALDAVRFIAAFIVALHHSVAPPIVDYVEHAGFSSALTVYRSVFFGSAAVSVFFIVSGFCIHGPYVNAPPEKWSAYFARRYIRIALPFIVILLPAFWLGVSYHPYTGFITWSLICEVAYYTLYPILRRAWQTFGWTPVLVVSYAIGYWSLRLQSLDIEEGGFLYALLIVKDVLHNLPIWLLGCLLADLSVRHRTWRAGRWIWPARALMAITMFATGWLHYTRFVSLADSLPIAAPIFAICIWCEIYTNTAPAFLVNAGRWSYSLYLVHPLAFYGIMPHLQLFQNNRQWLFGVLVCLAASYSFYRAVELPSHRLARLVHDRILVRRTDATEPETAAIGRFPT